MINQIELKKLIDGAVYRSERSQHDAKILFHKMCEKYNVDPKDKALANTDWYHYLNGELSPGQMGEILKELFNG